MTTRLLIRYLLLIITLSIGPITSYAAIPGQTPWQSIENGDLVKDVDLQHTVGYDFIPAKDGRIVRIYGFFNGSNTVSLWDKETGKLLSQAVVTSRNNWSSTEIKPVFVEEMKVYTVSVYIKGAGASLRYYPSLDHKKDIQILGSTYILGDNMPIYDMPNDSESLMLGLVDVGFVPADQFMEVHRHITMIAPDIFEVALNVYVDEKSTMDGFIITEQYPKDWEVLEASHDGIYASPSRLETHTIEWLGGTKLAELEVKDEKIIYRIKKGSNDFTFSGDWITTHSQGNTIIQAELNI